MQGRINGLISWHLTLKMPPMQRYPQMDNFIERRKHVCLTDDQMDQLIAEVSEHVVKRVEASLKDMMYRELGKSIAEQAPGMLSAVIGKLFWLLGIVTMGIYVYLQTHGMINDN